MSDKLSKMTLIILNIFIFTFFTSMLLLSYVRMEINNLSSIEITFWVLLSVLSILAIAFLLNSFSKITYLIFLLLISLFLRLAWVFTIQTPLASDFSILYKTAVEIVNGSQNYLNDFYFQKWSYQLGFSVYEAIIVNFFGPHTLPLKLFNVAFSIGITVIIYKIASNLFNEFTGRIAGFLYAIYIPSIVMTSVLTNQHLSTFLYFLGFALLIHFGLKSKKSWVFIGILFALGNIIRPLGSFILLAIGIYIILKGIFSGSLKTFSSYFIKFIGIIAVFFFVQQIIFYSLINIGIADKPLNNEDSLWKFVTGFNYETKGSYSAKDKDYLDQFALGDERNEKSKELIKERLSDKKKVALLIKHKIAYMWGGKDLSIHWSLLRTDKTDDFRNQLYKFEKILYMSMAIFGMAASAGLFLRKNINHKQILFMLLILGYGAIHVLIEVQTRYRYDMMPAVFIVQSYGVYVLSTFIIKKQKSIQSDFEKAV